MTIAGTRPAGAHPAGSLGHPHLVGPVGFGWRGACALFCCSQFPPPSAQDPVPARLPAMPCPAWPRPGLPCRALVSQVQPGRCPPARHCPVTRPSHSVCQSHAAAAFSLCGLPVSLPTITTTHHHHPRSCRPPSFFPPASPSPHPHLWLNSSGKSPEVSCLVLTVHSFNPFYLLDS